jgi:hypothetical protein
MVEVVDSFKSTGFGASQVNTISQAGSRLKVSLTIVMTFLILKSTYVQV